MAGISSASKPFISYSSNSTKSLYLHSTPGRGFYGGIEALFRMERPVSISNIATEINPAQEWDVGTVKDAELRVKIVEERARFEKSPKEFWESYRADKDKLQEQITSARSYLSSVTTEHELRVIISKVCPELNVDGLRGDIVTNRAAKALPTVIPNCLRHRLRKDRRLIPIVIKKF